MSSSTEHKSDAKTLSEKIKDIHIAMMTTAEPDGTLRSRPMASLDLKTLETDGDLWFLTSVSAHKVEEVRQSQRINLSYSKPGDNLFVSVSGTAELVHDQKHVKKLWKSAYEAWFPDGPDDPALALLRVHVDEAEYWNAPSSKMRGIFKVFSSHKQQPPTGADVKLDMH
ncbi:pyridoxamine 5'-phosphate oxidase family protein [Dictyobacter arantiisoli]|uniref:General stress protein n=1 Tax=Dictyobacter arantiisoli TaxID=2014874 RepID=A0A5A5TDL0_9CHLR|nr:pyridoxamine 5'-phosphate oxidase family protein [Dictyobacter arantiisoli]GCF09129.1 general stress protein [Dictyobacter arantiisoli]